MKAKDRMKFALEFAEMDLERKFKRLENEKTFRDDFSAFLYGKPGDAEPFSDRGGTLAMTMVPLSTWKKDNFISLQEDCRLLLRAFANPLGMLKLKLTVEYGFLPLVSMKAHLPMIWGEDIRDVFLVMLWQLVSGPAGEHVGQCPESQCPQSKSGNKLFYKPTVRAEYCSKQCSTRVRVRRKRAKPSKPAGPSCSCTTAKD